MTESSRFDLRFKGIPLSGGCAAARVCMFDSSHHHTATPRNIEPHEAADEETRVRDAMAKVGLQLDELRARVEREIGKAEAGIFSAQSMILQDPTLERRIMDAIRTLNLKAESAVSEALDYFASKLLAFDNEYMKERASDFGELRRRIIDALTGTKPSFQCSEDGCRRGHNRIVVAEELTPYLTLELDTGHVLGLVSEKGGKNSHAAILARALGIPAVSGIAGIRAQVHCGMELMINGDTGEVVAWPSDKTIAECRDKHLAEVRAPEAEPPVPGLVVMANINMPSDMTLVLQMQAEGVGLYRTEFELIVADKPLTEEELGLHYATVTGQMGKYPVIFRLFDIGSDKPLPSLAIGAEDNPALGLRGARLLLKNPDLLRMQARALALASRAGPVQVMYPMVVDREQFLRLREAFEDSIRGMTVGEIRHGCMFEVPSACLDADAIFREADFGSVGTNDLAQYLFAADRNNANVADDMDPDHPAFWRVIRMLTDAAGAHGKAISVCGEMAGNIRHVDALLDAGIRSLSVNPRRIPMVRQHLRQRAPGAQ